ncbi:hypothetical protein GCM10027053_39950 [Intrasporangium mesophilum]
MAERMTVKKAGATALAEIGELVGCPAEGVTGVRKDADVWVVTVEVLEVGRVPETTDVMASYEVQIDPDGDVVGYRRLRRYLRADVEGT